MCVCECVSYRLRGLDEHLALAQLELVLVHVDRAEEVQDPLPLVSAPAGPRLLGEDGVPAGNRPISTRTLIVRERDTSCTQVKVKRL